MNDYPRPIRYPDQVLSPAPPVLEGHPYIRLTRSQDFREMDLDPAKKVLVSLTQTEIRTLALHHLNSVYHFLCFRKLGGSFGGIHINRDACYRDRCGKLLRLLSQEDQEKFREIMRIRNMCIDIVRDPAEKPML